ncbi:hypothetical protein EHM76_05150 [bacterium]|nr:MAG: hypothetical protein EHM76_05150 [bacterium]
MKIKTFVTILVLSFYISCSNGKSGYETKWNVNSDTLSIKGRSAIFYSPSQPEYDLYIVTDSTGEIDAVIDDFVYYISIAKDSIEIYDSTISTIYTASRYISVTNSKGKIFVIDKYLDCDHIVGCIYFDGQSKPNVTCGIGTEDDIMMDVRKNLPKN